MTQLTETPPTQTFQLFTPLGSCCACELTGPSVRHLIALPRRAPIPGTGWECTQCGQPADGAIAVLCTACLYGSVPIRFAIRGYPGSPDRTPIADLGTERFDHRMDGHPEAAAATDPYPDLP